MKIRSVILRLALAALLVFSQLAATAHALEHLNAPTQSSTHHEQLPNEPACQHCLAFLSMGSALASSTFDFPPLLAGHTHLTIDRVDQIFLARTRLFDSRAPPSARN
ncbi:MAG: hypothetical protein WCK63_10575 [Betaproteobacteria bacterium]